VIVPESPKALVLDGTLGAWALWVVVHGAAALTVVLTIAILVLRLLIAWRDYRRPIQ
jgi:hypothetical protein